ncbi:inosine/xanthosine triphosphatase [uncultured Arcticibacterium sp.]|uniref:inosine/xanthosine triphosphatase n=1 Tax=uncultured Arcticibacterium sp. TaxID=2173042 RepID=UPI0030FB1C87
MKVIVASKNPVKISAARKGFELNFPGVNINFEGVSVPSGVPDQPMGSQETYDGAYNRAVAARKLQPDADYWVGLEGGNIAHGEEMEVMAWIVILSKDKLGKGRTAGFFLPQKTIELVKQGYELGKADELVHGIQNSKQKMGSSGILTDNLIDRETFYVPAVIFALIPFKKVDLY